MRYKENNVLHLIPIFKLLLLLLIDEFEKKRTIYGSWNIDKL